MGIFLLSDYLGGAEQLLFRLAKHLGIKNVFIFYSGKNQIWQNAGFDVVYFNGSFIRLISTIKKYKFQTVYSSHLMMNSILGFLRTANVLKTNFLVCRESTSVFLRYNGFKLLKYKLAYMFGYKNIDLLITQTEPMRELLLANVPYLSKRTKIKTIPNLFVFPKSINSNIIYNFPFVVSAGRFIPEKGFDILISAFAKLRNFHPELKLVVLGEGDERKELEKMIFELGIEDNVILPGHVQDVFPYFNQAELCVVSSRVEGFPNVLLQMMSQNTKVVSTLCAGGIEELKGVSTCQINNEESLYLAMSDTLKKDTSFNRILFDNELKSRSIGSFLKKIELYLYGK